MLFIPAIELKEGQHVDPHPSISDKPAEMAVHYCDQGALRLHLLDLDGCVQGKPRNLPLIRDILAAVDPETTVQLGGGISDLDTIEKYLDIGLRYVVIGTAAVKTPNFLRDACDAFPDQIIVGLNAKEGMVVTDGWTRLTGQNVIDLARRFEDYGVNSVVYTDMGQDGMLMSVHVDATVRLAQALRIPVIASGGLNNLELAKQLIALESEGIAGVIIGPKAQAFLSFTQVLALITEADT